MSNPKKSFDVNLDEEMDFEFEKELKKEIQQNSQVQYNKQINNNPFSQHVVVKQTPGQDQEDESENQAKANAAENL